MSFRFFPPFFHLIYLDCSAGGMALSTLVPATVSSISLLAKSSLAGLQIWSLHGLLLTIEAAGLSFVSYVQVFQFLTVMPSDNGFYLSVVYFDLFYFLIVFRCATLKLDIYQIQANSPFYIFRILISFEALQNSERYLR